MLLVNTGGMLPQEDKMSTEQIQPEGDRIRKAIKWISGMVQEYPEKSRKDIIQEAEIRFDLTPKECSFLHEKFS